MDEVAVKPRAVMPETARTLPAEYYVSRAYFDREMERLFAPAAKSRRRGRETSSSASCSARASSSRADPPA
jgi:hypothetical protein